MNDIQTKQCRACKEFKPATREVFAPAKKCKNGLSNLCKQCKNAARRKIIPVPEGCRRCARCKADLPATQEFFSYRSRSKDNLNEYCRVCDKAIYQEKRNKPIPEERPSLMICAKCGDEKPFTLDFFYREPTYQYGLNTACIVCVNQRIEGYRQTHKAEHNTRVHRWRMRNRERHYTNQKRWAANNRERRREQERQRRLIQPELFSAKRKRYQQSEHGRLKDRVYSRNRKTRLKGIPGHYTVEDVQQQFIRQKGKCYWCKQKLLKYHIDHIIPVTREGSSNDPSNLVLACVFCNISRNNRLPHEWPEGGRLL